MGCRHERGKLPGSQQLAASHHASGRSYLRENGPERPECRLRLHGGCTRHDLQQHRPETAQHSGSYSRQHGRSVQQCSAVSVLVAIGVERGRKLRQRDVLLRHRLAGSQHVAQFSVSVADDPWQTSRHARGYRNGPAGESGRCDGLRSHHQHHLARQCQFCGNEHLRPAAVYEPDRAVALRRSGRCDDLELGQPIHRQPERRGVSWSDQLAGTHHLRHLSRLWLRRHRQCYGQFVL